MGFDGPGKPLFEIPVSDTQSYKQFGNAVVVPVVNSVAEYMRAHIMAVMDQDELQEALDLSFDKPETEKRVAHA